MQFLQLFKFLFFVIQGLAVSKSYSSNGQVTVILDGTDFNIPKGSFHALVGRSGTGKTTVLNLLGGLDQPTSGQILFEQTHLEAMSDAELSAFRNRSVGFVFQSFFLRPLRTALENTIVPLMFGDMPVKKSRERGIEALREVGLGAYVDKPVRRLSGGQRQRVAIARAIVNRPTLLLADEPTGNLDTATSLEIFELLRAYNQRHGTTVVVVTHDPLVERFAIPMLTIDRGALISYTGKI